ncbi:hypothetical protein GCM10008941_03090 [Rhizomicrobium palustre]
MAISEAENRAFARLEEAFGDTLWAMLRHYIRAGETISEHLSEAVLCAHWQEAVRLALELGAAGAPFAFSEIDAAAKAFAASVYEGNTAHARRNAAQMVVFEFEKTTLMLQSRYPGLVES